MSQELVKKTGLVRLIRLAFSRVSAGVRESQRDGTMIAWGSAPGLGMDDIFVALKGQDKAEKWGSAW